MGEMALRIKNMYDEFQKRDMNDILNEVYNVADKKLYDDPKLRADYDSRTHSNSNNQVDYAEGIQCKRLIDGKFYDVNLLDIDEDKKEDSFDIETSVFKDRYREMAVRKNESTSKKLDKVIKRAISNVKEMTSIKVFKFLSFFWIVSLATMSSFQLIFMTQFFTTTDNLVDIMLEANKQLALFARINSEMLDLSFIREGYFNPANVVNNTVTCSGVISNLNLTADNVIKNTKKLMDKTYLEKIGFQNQQFRFYDSLSVISGNKDNYFEVTFDHHIQMLLSPIMNLTKDPDCSEDKSTDLKTFQYNYYRELKPRIDQFSETLYKYLLDETSSLLRTQFGMFLLLVSEATSSLVFLIYYIWLKIRVLRKKQEILFLFLDIPRKEVQGIFKKCEGFLNFCNAFRSDKEQENKMLLDSSDEEDSFEKEMNGYIQVQADNADSTDVFERSIF